MREMRLKELGRWHSGGTPPKEHEDYWAGDIPWISAKDIASTTLREPTTFITEKAARDHSRLAPSGALLLIVRGMALAHGLPVVQTVDRVAFNQDLRALVVTPDLDARFIFYSLIGHRWKLDRHIDKAAHGTARVIDSIYTDRLPIPDLDVQRQIVAFLDPECARIDELRRELMRFREATAEAVVETMARMLDARELGLALQDGARPAGWPHLAQYVDKWFAGGTPSSHDSAHWTADIDGRPWVAIGDMSGRRNITTASRHLTASGIAAARLEEAPAGTLLLAMYASVGEVAELEMPASFNQALIGLFIENPQQRAFIQTWLRVMKPFWPWFTKSNTQANLTQLLVRHCPIVPLERFNLDQINREISTVEERGERVVREVDDAVATLAAYRDALITEAVTGRLPVASTSASRIDEALHAACEGELPEVLAS